MTSFISLLVTLLIISSVNGSKYTLKDTPVTSDLCDSSVKSLSGYFNVESGNNKNYFFWFFESRAQPSSDPLIIWLTGGPGCSSQLALMTENGPCQVTPDGLSTVNNPYSWNNNANIMWIDQPAQVGFSYGTKIIDNDHNEQEVAEDMYHFLQAFFNAHPEYVKNEFFVFGESYGGHYAPSIANRIYQGNVNNEGIIVNLQGVGVGNGLTDPVVQYQYYPEMAMNNSYGIKTVSEEVYSSMMEKLSTCKKMAQACQLNSSACVVADDYCNLAETSPYYNTGLNPYDIKKECGSSSLCYDFTNVETFFNLETTRTSLHVSDKVKTWKTCNNVVNAMFQADWMKDYQTTLIPMLENGIRVLIYAGDLDFICNWIGNKAWTKELLWSGAARFNFEKDHDWMYYNSTTNSDVKGGYARTAKALKGEGSLTFLQVFEAGHMVPMDQPVAALSMLNTFIFNKKFY